MDKVSLSFFHLLSCVINGGAVDCRLFESFSSADWERLYALSVKQGVVGVVYEGVKTVPKDMAPSKAFMMRWLSHALSIEKQMMKKGAVAADFAGKMFEKDIPVVVLKGLSFASYFPNPCYREFGDLDCYLLGRKEEGDEIAVEFGAKKKDAGYKHSHLYYNGLMIENHRYLTSFDNSRQGVRTERLLQELIASGHCYIGGTKLLMPCAEFNALFLIKHAQRHFIKEGICVRHMLDWAFFLKSESGSVDWSKVIELMEECRILNFAKVMTALCIDKFGMDVDIAGLRDDIGISDAVLDDILAGYPGLVNENIIKKTLRLLRRLYRMWKFRKLADENYFRLVWNSIAFNSYIKMKPQL